MDNTVVQEPIGVRDRGFFSRLSRAQQRKLFTAFEEYARLKTSDTVLDIGILSSTVDREAVNFSRWADPPLRSRINVFHLHCASGCADSVSDWMNAPELTEGVRLPFRDGAFDWICCNSVIEHAGNSTRQFQLVHELTRVARKGIFLATQNRRHPVDFQTDMPFVHWLPDIWRRRVLRWSGKSAEALESRPNLLRAGSLYGFAGMLSEKTEYEVGHKRVFGLKAHFFLMITKK